MFLSNFNFSCKLKCNRCANYEKIRILKKKDERNLIRWALEGTIENYLEKTLIHLSA